MTVGAEMSSQQTALSGLIFARELGWLREINDIAHGMGPVNVVRNSFAGRLFEEIMPEEVQQDNS